jgi:transcriptional regulator with XRE-family HTH domain
MSPAYVGRLERGEVAPGIDMVARIAAALSVDPAVLITVPAATGRLESLRGRIRGQIETLLTDEEAPTLEALALLLRAMVEARIRRRARGAGETGGPRRPAARNPPPREGGRPRFGQADLVDLERLQPAPADVQPRLLGSGQCRAVPLQFRPCDQAVVPRRNLLGIGSPLWNCGDEPTVFQVEQRPLWGRPSLNRPLQAPTVLDVDAAVSARRREHCPDRDVRSHRTAGAIARSLEPVNLLGVKAKHQSPGWGVEHDLRFCEDRSRPMLDGQTSVIAVLTLDLRQQLIQEPGPQIRQSVEAIAGKQSFTMQQQAPADPAQEG